MFSSKVSVSPLPSQDKTLKRVIKIKSPTNDIKVHKVESTNVFSDTSLRRNACKNHENEDKITKCWNDLKMMSLTNAIVIASDVGACTLGPQSSASISSECEYDKPDLDKAVTSTPVKCNKRNRNENKSPLNTSENQSLKKMGIPIDDPAMINTLSVLCHHKVESYINKRVQEQTKSFVKSWQIHEQKMKDNAYTLKTELDNQRIQRMEERDAAVQKIILETQAKANLKTQEQQHQRMIENDKRIAEAGERLRLIEEKRKEVEENKKKSAQELVKCIEGIYYLLVNYNEIHNHICQTNNACKNMQLLNEKLPAEFLKLKSMNECMTKLIEKSSKRKVTLKDLNTAELLVQDISALEDIFAYAVEEINNEVELAQSYEVVADKHNEPLVEINEQTHEKAAGAENNTVQSEELEKEKIKEEQQPQNVLLTGDVVEDCVSGENLNWHLELNQFYEDYNKNLEPLVTNDAFKPFRFQCKKVVCTPINAISPVDGRHLQDKYQKLKRLLQGQSVSLDNTTFHATGHPLGIAFCTNLMAKKFVNQGERVVSSKPVAAFAIAAVIVALWAEFPDFGRLLLAHFHRTCPYLIPMFLPQIEGQSNESYYQSLGYEYSEDGKVEKQTDFLKRMSGLMRLYSAILITPLKRSLVEEGKHHPHNIKEGWRWLTASLNLNPRFDISTTLICNFLEVAGDRMFKTYNNQFIKLLKFICNDYFPLIEQITPDGCGGPVSRLSQLLETILKKGKVPPPEGLLPSNFW